MASDDWWKTIHRRIVQGDPTAPAELAQHALPQMQSHLKQCRFDIKDPDLIDDAAIDALMSYIKNPGSYQQHKRKLLGYLNMSAEGDLRNALAKADRRRKRERRDESVELRSLAGNKDNADDQVERNDRVDSKLKSLFPDLRDQQLAELIVEGVRSTDSFAEVLGIRHLDLEEQRREVKRHKDRIKKILKRKGGRSNG